METELYNITTKNTYLGPSQNIVISGEYTISTDYHRLIVSSNGIIATLVLPTPGIDELSANDGWSIWIKNNDNIATIFVKDHNGVVIAGLFPTMAMYFLLINGNYKLVSTNVFRDSNNIVHIPTMGMNMIQSWDINNPFNKGNEIIRMSTIQSIGKVSVELFKFTTITNSLYVLDYRITCIRNSVSTVGNIGDGNAYGGTLMIQNKQDKIRIKSMEKRQKEDIESVKLEFKYNLLDFIIYGKGVNNYTLDWNISIKYSGSVVQ